jgi:hypothetical protein
MNCLCVAHYPGEGKWEAKRINNAHTVSLSFAKWNHANITKYVQVMRVFKPALNSAERFDQTAAGYLRLMDCCKI